MSHSLCSMQRVVHKVSPGAMTCNHFMHQLILAFLNTSAQDRYKSKTDIAAPGLPVLKYLDFVVSHSMYDMKRAVHKISQTELIYNIFFCFSPSVFYTSSPW